DRHGLQLYPGRGRENLQGDPRARAPDRGEIAPEVAAPDPIPDARGIPGRGAGSCRQNGRRAAHNAFFRTELTRASPGERRDLAPRASRLDAWRTRSRTRGHFSISM